MLPPPDSLSSQWLVSGQAISLEPRAAIMGIVNVTPDSFSDGGHHFSPETAIEHGLKLIEEGADILDIGGESTRPGAQPVSVEEEMRRVMPVIAALRQRTSALLSIDTFKAPIAAAALQAGAHIINDVSGFRSEAMIQVAAQSHAGLVIMHMQGQPRTMQLQPSYDDVLVGVSDFLSQRIAALTHAGVALERIVLDPGIGFGKTLEHNLTLLRHLPALRLRSRPGLTSHGGSALAHRGSHRPHSAPRSIDPSRPRSEGQLRLSPHDRGHFGSSLAPEPESGIALIELLR
jgi:dihydropteroate synthase